MPFSPNRYIIGLTEDPRRKEAKFVEEMIEHTCKKGTISRRVLSLPKEVTKSYLLISKTMHRLVKISLPTSHCRSHPSQMRWKNIEK